ncbi:MAG: hypothetical protein WCF98_07515 [Synechococcus sp. ELA057]|jgi:hypothetical protein
MIVLKITNASEVVASKVGKLLESLTPDALDQSMVEDVLIQKLVEQLQQEGLKGEVAAVQGLDLQNKELTLRDRCHVRIQRSF